LFVKTVGETFVYVSFQDLSFSKAFFFSSFFFFFFLGGGYWAFLFYGLNQDLMDSVHMYSTFFRFSDHFLIVSGHSQIPSFSSFSNICPSVGCDTTQGYLTKKKKNFTSAQIKTARGVFISKGYKKIVFPHFKQDWSKLINFDLIIIAICMKSFCKFMTHENLIVFA
jgi:hypothetical protein